eukprot:1134435-Prorocentrum_minimum.AAC.2
MRAAHVPAAATSNDWCTLRVYSRTHLRQRCDGGGAGVQLAAAVIGHPDGVGAVCQRQLCVAEGHHPLEHHLGGAKGGQEGVRMGSGWGQDG